MDIQQLLNINLSDLRNFSLQANLVENEQNKRIIERNKTILRRIENTHMQAGYHISVSQKSVDDVIKKVKKLAKGEGEELSLSELRILSYHLSQLIGHETTFEYALEAIDNTWRNIFFNGLIYFLMSSWNDLSMAEFETVSYVLTSRLKSYSDNNKKYLLFKNHSNLFEENGPSKMCALLKAKDIPLEEAPSILCLNNSSFSHSYYDDVIINYFTRDNLDDIGYIENILTKHNSTKTKKLVCANLIIDANRNGSDKRQVEVGNAARRLLGDISIPTTWAPFNGATEEDVAKLKRAYEIVALWYAKQVIQTFFDVCVQDPERKRFWLKYIKEISDFRIVGSSSIKSSLVSDARVRQQLPKIFVETNSVRNKTAALVMYIRDKVFVEFSDIGSVYIYPPNHNAVRLVRLRRYIDNISDLKDTLIGKAVELDCYYTYNDYGSLRHAGAWQGRLDGWMESKILSQPKINQSNIDEIFTTPQREATKKEEKCGGSGQKETKQKFGPYENGFVPIQKGLFDEDYKIVIKPKTNKESPSVEQKGMFLKGKHIFEGQYQIGLSLEGLYICKVSNGHAKKLYTYRLTSLQKGQIWIKKQRTDGYLPIVFNQNDTPKTMGGIKLIGNEILYKDEHFSVKRFKTSEI